MTSSVRYCGTHSTGIDLPSLGLYGLGRLDPVDLDDDIAAELIARGDFEAAPKKAAARKAAPKTDPAPAGDDKPAKSASDNQSEED